MTRALPPLNWFRSFEAAARHLSFTAAAQEIGLTQSAISQQVRALETRLGTDLFTRKARGLALTDAGRRLLPDVERALSGLSAATRGFETAPQAHIVSVATSLSVAQWLIQPRLSAFLAANPGLSIRLINAVWPDEFKAARADVEIRFGSEAQVGHGAQRLAPDGLIAVHAPDLSPDLARATLIETLGTSLRWQDWAEANAWALPNRPRIYVDAFGPALDLACQGTGVALTSALLARGALADGRVLALPGAPLASPEGYFLACDQRSRSGHVFADWMQSQINA